MARGKAPKGLKGSLRRYEEAERLKRKHVGLLDAQKKFELQKKKSITGAKNQQNKPGMVPFSYNNTVLLVGEGDFSFAVSIIQQNYILPSNLVASSFDSREKAFEKYSSVAENIELLEAKGVKVVFEVDATNLAKSLGLGHKKSKKTLLAPGQKLDIILFNFPHTGRGIKDVDRNIRDHQQLVLDYFKSCNQLFPVANDPSLNADLSGYTKEDAERIVLSIFEGEPYVSWGIKAIARSQNWKVERSGRFDWTRFPEYHHRRTNSMKDTTKEASLREARIYVFERKPELAVGEK